jgi:GNAT superfamily N-acetyltransferase
MLDGTLKDLRQLDGASFAEHAPALAEILADAVASGASVGFVKPFTVADARAWWSTLEPEIAAGRIVLLGAFQDGALVGTVQLRLAAYPNARHRAEVAKLLVHRRARGQGFARALMARIEDEARALGRTLLLLDTLTGSDAERLYRALGYQCTGVVPGHAALPDGRLMSTTFFWRAIA